MNKKLRKPEFVSLLTNTACYCIFTTRKNYSVSSETSHLWCFDRFNFVNVFLHHPLDKYSLTLTVAFTFTSSFTFSNFTFYFPMAFWD